MIVLIGLLTVVATLVGGALALRYKDRLHLILGFSAGAVIGVALFDLLPEALELTEGHFEASFVSTLIAIGFGLFMFLDRLLRMHAHDDDGGQQHRGRFGAGALSVHSFLDGLGIGLAFQVSTAVGAVVTAAVLAHDFSDGLNTVNIVLKNRGSRTQAVRWLITDALAPLAGIIVASFLTLPNHLLGALLALFCGFFIYIGASDILPESHHRHPTIWTTLLTVAGMLFVYIAIAGH
jgi:ZIP family zinc transporter